MRTRIDLLIALSIGFLIPCISSAGAPTWARSGTMERNGQTLKVVCIGSGPSLDLARTEAMASCRNSAMGQLQSNLTIRSEIFESERDTAYHQETKQLATYSGLQCFPEKEELDTSADQVTVYLKCRYDLKNVKVTDASKETNLADSKNVGADSVIANQAALNKLSASDAKIEEKKIAQSEAVQVIIASVPACDSIIIRSKRPDRVVRCTENPQTVLVHTESDTDLVVRAKGYLPKTIPLQRRGTTSLETETIHVYLSK